MRLEQTANSPDKQVKQGNAPRQDKAGSVAVDPLVHCLDKPLMANAARVQLVSFRFRLAC